MSLLANLKGIDLVWVGLAGIYGERFTRPFGEDPRSPIGAMWSAGLRDLNDDQLRRGLSACMMRGDDFPPSAGAFRALCLDILSLDRVRHELRLPNEERSPFTRMVWLYLDTYAFTRGDDYKANEALKSAVATAHDARMRGDAMPLPTPKLEGPKKDAWKPRPSHTNVNPEAVKKEIDALAQFLKSKPPSTGDTP